MSAPLHAPVLDSQGRLTISLVDDPTIVTASTGTTTPLTYVSRLSTQDADHSTKVTQKVEIGTNGIVGGVAALSEFKGKLTREDVNCALLGLLTGKKQNATPGATTNWGYFDLSNSKFDYCRLIADSQGVVYAAWVAMGCVLSGAQFDTKNTGEAQESYDCMGPQLVYMNMIPISKNYVVQTGDVAPNKILISSVLGTGEAPNVVGYMPAAGQPASAVYASGRINFLSIKRTLTTTMTIGGVTYSAGSVVRIREVQNYLGASAAFGTAGVQTITLKANADTYRDGSTVPNRVGPEIQVGSLIFIDDGANQETATVTAVASGSVTCTTTKTHALTDVFVSLKPPSGYCVYSPQVQKIEFFGDPLVSSDLFRLLFASDVSTSTPTQIGTTSLDTTSQPGIPGRLTPVTISAYQIPRVQSASIKVTIDRKQVQGCGETEIVYGTAGVPKIDYSLDVLKTDNVLIALLSSGQTVMSATTTGDVFPMDYIVRYGLANPTPFIVQIKSPAFNANVLKTYTGSQAVFASFGETGTSEAELTQKLSGTDYSGVITISATT